MRISNYTFSHPKNYLYSKPVKGLQSYGLGYGFAFNGKEKDNETYGEGNAYDFGARIYDSRLGRWLSLDPLQAKYPHLSPYNFVANNPIIFEDVDGKDYQIVIDKVAKTVTIVATYYVNDKKTEELTNKAAAEIMASNGKFALKDENGEKYKINFQLDVINTESSNKFEPINRAEDDSKGNSVKENSSEEYKFELKKIDKNADPNDQEGFTSFGERINTDLSKTGVDEEMRTHVIKHEILHTLGADHPNRARSAKINKKTVKAILTYSSLTNKKGGIAPITLIKGKSSDTMINYENQDHQPEVETKSSDNNPLQGKVVRY